MLEMLGRYITIMSKKENRHILFVGIVLVVLGVNQFLHEYGVCDYRSYLKNPQQYHIMEGTITNIQSSGIGKFIIWKTTVCCNETGESYELYSRREDRIGQNVIFGHNMEDTSYENIWLKPYIPKDADECLWIILSVLYTFFFYFCYQMFREANRTKLTTAQVLYKKTARNFFEPVEEYAICLCHDENGKEHFMKTLRKVRPMGVEVKDELLVMVNPKNYKNYRFLEENTEVMKMQPGVNLDEIMENIDKYI